MASKNPVKGYIPCHMPNCTCVATVHAVGEHKAQTDGEKPRNPRNLGRLYYICPVHGCQQGKGQEFQDYIKANMKATREEAEAAISKPPVKPESKPLDKPEKTGDESPPKPVKTRLEAVKPYLYILAVCAVIVIALNTRKSNHEQAA
ncbi:hypothetical protein [Vibrio nigripulchritudo]|uniref:hypothetical protein n=1 Tax=Vibrio nigripulchritudo TaxID=28173 RepID=UPI002491A022|nr:hypothetical protein [Vibrio nigripulchritudo]BDU42887.1 hypothetical protein TUMSATVNIG3_16850 [Vibrio nigripulchritudo]